jgi:hypothetical protein
MPLSEAEVRTFCSVCGSTLITELNTVATFARPEPDSPLALNRCGDLCSDVA